MKTAISIPDPVFREAEDFAEQRDLTRSALYAAALQEYIQKHRDDYVVKKLDALYVREESALPSDLEELQSRSLPKEEW